MKPIFRTVLLLCPILLFSGCAGTGVATRQSVRFPNQSASVENPEHCRIVLIRPAGDGPFTLLVREGRKRIGSVKEGAYLCWERPPGEIELTGQWDKHFDSTRINAEKNTVHYVQLRLVPQMFGSAQPKLSVIDDAQAKKVLRNCKPPVANAELARTLKVSDQHLVELGNYKTVTVIPFQNPPGSNDGTIGSAFADEIYENLKNAFPNTYDQVRFGQPLNQPNELVVSGTVKSYDPGSRVARFIVAGAGAASFDSEVIFSDGSTKQLLFSSTLDKFWAWGGMLGAAKGVDDMVSQSAIAVAATLARGKGWKPQ